MVGTVGLLVLFSITSVTARVLGQRIRQLRIQRSLTQQDLAGEDYSKSYISAIEQGKTRPSLEALQRIASRLRAPASLLLDPDPAAFQNVDEDQLPKRVRKRRGLAADNQPQNSPVWAELQLARARQQVYTGDYQGALNTLEPFLTNEQGQSAPAYSLEAYQVAQALYIAALASYPTSLGASVDYLERGIQMSERLHDRETLEKMRNLYGMILFRRGQPLAALEQHSRCAEAIESGAVTDPNFRVQVYSNLAEDFRALHSTDRALEAYGKALEAVGRVNSLQRQAAILWSLAQEAASNPRSMLDMNLQAARALGVRQAIDNLRQVSESEARYGEALLELGELEEAEHYLRNSLTLASNNNMTEQTALALGHLARLSIQRDDLRHAEEYVQEAIAICREALQPTEQAEEAPDREAMSTALASALSLAGEIAARNGNMDSAHAQFREAIALVENARSREVAGSVYQRYAQVLARAGQHEQASRYYERAYPFGGKG
jgi:HTH-type transcriptional regulator, quorum sensing regulator NprR